MKKLIFFIFILINTFTFSISITVSDQNNIPLKDVFIKINNEVKLSNSKGITTFNTKDKILNISVSKEGYESQSLNLNNNPNLKLSLVINPLIYSNLTFKLSENKGFIKYKEIGRNQYTKVPFFKNIKNLTLPKGSYDFIFSSEDSEEKHKFITLKKSEELYTINFEKNKNNFYFIGNSGDSQSINFYKEDIKKLQHLKDSNLLIFKNETLVKKLTLKDTFTSTYLEDGVYNLVVQNKFHPGVYFRGVKLNKDSFRNVVLTIPSVLTNVSGVIKNKNQLIGGVKVTLTDVQNNNYETFSNFVGEFSIALPPQKYKITLSKPGFILDKGQNLIYDFSIPKNNYFISLGTEELPSSIQGIVTDNKSNPISNAKITVKNGSQIINLKSDNFGNFSTSILPGLLFIKVEKEGYKSFGVVNKLERFSTLSGLKIPLTPFLSGISGVITDNSKPLKSVRLTLRDKEGEIKATAISNENGYYEFADVSVNKEYFISVGDRNYKYFYSDPFVLGKEDIENKNIILQKRNSRLYIEFLDKFNNPLKNKNVVVGEKNLVTDSNGFLLFNLPEKQNKFQIKIASYNYNKKIDFDSEKDNPKQLTLIVN